MSDESTFMRLARRIRGALEQEPAPYTMGPEQEPIHQSFAAPVADHIDRVTGNLEVMGRGAMKNAGLPGWAQTAGDIAMDVAAAPVRSISAASKLAMAPFDWATGRQVLAKPMDALEAVPLVASGAYRVGKAAMQASDLKRQYQATQAYMDNMRRNASGGMLPADRRLRDMISNIPAGPQ